MELDLRAGNVQREEAQEIAKRLRTSRSGVVATIAFVYLLLFFTCGTILTGEMAVESYRKGGMDDVEVYGVGAAFYCLIAFFLWIAQSQRRKDRRGLLESVLILAISPIFLG